MSKLKNTCYNAYSFYEVRFTLYWMAAIDPTTRRFLKHLGLRLRDLRNKQELTLEETEEHGIKSWKHLQKIETGRNITMVTLLQLSRIYKVHPSEILKGL